MKKFQINIKRIYDEPSVDDGLRILVDRLWPRGITKEKAAIDYWYKEIAPSKELREWYGHKEEKFNEFAKLYTEELKQQKELLKNIKKLSYTKPITLLYAAKTPQTSQAIVLKEIIEKIQ